MNAALKNPKDVAFDSQGNMLIVDGGNHRVRKVSNGIITTGETYKAAVKLTFARGAALKDPKKLFNSSLEGNTRRAIDIRQDDKVDAAAFKALFKRAVAFNKANPPKGKR